MRQSTRPGRQASRDALPPLRVRLPADLVAAERQYHHLMPVDLSPAGLPSPYPEHGPRFWPWLGIWAICNVLGSALALLLWPRGEPAHGAWFWFCVVGLPNCLFIFLFSIARAGYEAFWYRAHYRNIHRGKWLDKRVRFAQRPLQVLGAGYCLPLGGRSLAQVMATAMPLLKIQAPRNGPGTILHNRFEDAEGLVDDPEDLLLSMADEALDSSSAPPRQVATIAAKLAQALEPLSLSLHALSQYEPIHWPQVRVLAEPGQGVLREQQVRDALRIAELPPLQCHAVPATDGLLIADAWLDARERRPLLVIAVAWYDEKPPVGSTEGCVAVLLGPGYYQLPGRVRAVGTLHRPVAGNFPELKYVLGNAVIWGKAEGPAVTRAWITRIDNQHDTTLLAALREASLSGIAKHEAQSRVGRIVGDAGAADAWLSVAAAIESGMSGPQLIVDSSQAAVLYVTPNVNPVHSHDDQK